MDNQPTANSNDTLFTPEQIRTRVANWDKEPFTDAEIDALEYELGVRGYNPIAYGMDDIDSLILELASEADNDDEDQEPIDSNDNILTDTDYFAAIRAIMPHYKTGGRQTYIDTHHHMHHGGDDSNIETLTLCNWNQGLLDRGNDDIYNKADNAFRQTIRLLSLPRGYSAMIPTQNRETDSMLFYRNSAMDTIQIHFADNNIYIVSIQLSK